MDTAGFYPQDTETTLGEIFDMFPSLGRSSCVATKASAEVKPHFSLSRQSVVEQCNQSLERLGLDCIDLFYLQAADINTDINDTLDGIAELHQAEKITEFGLSNYPAWAVVDIWHRCKSRGMIMPTVYQGMYNILTRDLEREIIPVLREFGLRLYVYNPLAGGLLSGRYSSLEAVTSATEGRFSEEFDTAYGGGVKAGTVVYRNRYAKPQICEGLDVLRKACAPADVVEEPKVVEDTTKIVDGRKVRLVVSESAARPKVLEMANIALRWLIHHSCLAKGDGVILGVSKNAHLTANLGAWQGGALDDVLLEACNEAWERARPACQSYFQGYMSKRGPDLYLESDLFG